MKEIWKYDGWIRVISVYSFVILILNLVWEFLHMPLYTLYYTGSTSEIIISALHCTGGDLLIAMSALMLVLLFTSNSWPDDPKTYLKVAIMTTILGILYTLFSEWLNIEVRESWEYSEHMPTVPIINIGLSPFLQWIIIPVTSFLFARYKLYHW